MAQCKFSASFHFICKGPPWGDNFFVSLPVPLRWPSDFWFHLLLPVRLTFPFVLWIIRFLSIIRTIHSRISLVPLLHLKFKYGRLKIRFQFGKLRTPSRLSRLSSTLIVIVGFNNVASIAFNRGRCKKENLQFFTRSIANIRNTRNQIPRDRRIYSAHTCIMKSAIISWLMITTSPRLPHSFSFISQVIVNYSVIAINALYSH